MKLNPYERREDIDFHFIGFLCNFFSKIVMTLVVTVIFLFFLVNWQNLQ